MADSLVETKLKTTVLSEAHRALGARMVPFAGYLMPVQYPAGIMAEHNWTRSHAGLFDVSHMGQAFLAGPDHTTTAKALEALCPADILNLRLGQQRYSQLLNAEGGILDDFMATRLPDGKYDGILYLVVNAACKDADYAHIAAKLPDGVKLSPKDFALLALQGPEAVGVLEALSPGVAAMPFMTSRTTQIGDIWVQVSRSGYTGEDGFEISVNRRMLCASGRCCSPMNASGRSVSAHAIRSGSRPGSASTGMISTTRPHRSKARSPGRCRSAGARKAVFPVRRAFKRNWRMDRNASASG